MTTVKNFFDKFSEQYEVQSRYRHTLYKWIINTIFRNINKKKCSILDLGTGNGELGIRLAIKFPESEIVGLDISSGMINQAKKKVKKIGIKNIKFVVSKMEKLNVKKVDFAVSSVALHHIKNKELVLSKIYQILPIGGKLIIGDWFVPSEEYQKQVDILIKKNLERARKFEDSWKQLRDGMTKGYKKKHPKEYPVCPSSLKEIMKSVGFSKARIVKCPLSKFAVVIGEK
jgi:ubiquinone/menaquinone biosynthesis C-methylase UbiE